MKSIITILFIVIACCAKAQDSTSAYRKYLDQEVGKCVYKFHVVKMPSRKTASGPQPYFIPRYQIPKGSIFCRMEDKLTRATKVWIKIGTNNNK